MRIYHQLNFITSSQSNSIRLRILWMGGHTQKSIVLYANCGLVLNVWIYLNASVMQRCRIGYIVHMTWVRVNDFISQRF